MKRFKLKYIVIFVIMLIILGISGKLNKDMEQSEAQTEKINIASELLSCYEDNYNQEIIIAASCDLNMDEKEDAIIIYKENEKQNFMVAVVTEGDSYYITEPVKAPLENQKIKFKNIDDKAEMESIVSGEKNGNLGYAIFRIEDRQLKDIFAEGMESCC